jgi:rhodanese-related sulfurtransferase
VQLNATEQVIKNGSGLMISTISRDELKTKIDRRDNFLLVETLPRTAYQHAHLPGAINLPPDEVQQLAPTLLPDKDADIVVYCAKPT